MTTLAATIGRFIGAVLAECAPVLVAIIREILNEPDTVEDGAAPADLTARLLAKLHKHADDSGAAGRPGETPQDDL